MWVRRFQPQDAAGCSDVFHRAVHEGAAHAYTQAERDAWSPYPGTAERWARILSGQTSFVAERDGHVAGFMTLQRDGHVDFAYVAPEEMGKGTAQALYAAVLNAAACLSLSRLTTEASHLARPFFERNGWRVLKAQKIERHGVMIENFQMALERGFLSRCS